VVCKSEKSRKDRNPSYYYCNLLELSENHDAWKKSLRFVHSEPVSAILAFQKEKTLVAVSLQIPEAMVEYRHRLKLTVSLQILKEVGSHIEDCK
jgi:hypothetical protein